ncbi:hypothetical protein Jab_2c10360 [Janthinobacterium sp. HH01]|nr:hypothetical protein Jab_2c10360 [Janthinobacterium sp. HH01]
MIRATLFAILTMTTVLSHAAAERGGASVQKTAQSYIAAFRSGENFNPNDSVSGILINHSVSSASLTLVTKELTVGTKEVRVNIVQLLEKLGLEMDTPAPNKLPIIREHAVIRALLIGGFAKDDAAASLAATILTDRCKPSDLAAFGNIYTTSLQQSNGAYLYVAAKAKTTEARQAVEKMALQPKWRDEPELREAVRIAQAALGNTQIEDEFINAVIQAEKSAPPAPSNRFYNVGAAKDGTELAKRLEPLGLIGTRRSLLVVCNYLRSPLKSYVPNVSEKSVRYAALSALLYNFPDERVLTEPRDLADWSATEQFCVKNLGAVFDGPTPDIPPDQAYPTMMPRPTRK